MVTALELAYKVYEELKKENKITDDLRKRLEAIPSIVMSSGMFGLTLLALKNMGDKKGEGSSSEEKETESWETIARIVLRRFMSEKLGKEVELRNLIYEVHEISTKESSAVITREFLEYIKWLKYLVRAHVKVEVNEQ